MEPFALGTLSAPGQAPFPGLIDTGAGQVLDLWVTLGVPDLSTLLAGWDAALPELAALAQDATRTRQDLTGLRVHAPVQPRQVFQAGANYRQHVIDLDMAHRPPDDPRTEDEARAEIAAVMDRRAAEDLPYVFIGLPSAITGPYDDVVLPGWAAKPDWELELAAVIGRPTFRPGRCRSG